MRAQLLDGSARDVLDVVRHLGFLQMDPIAVVARPEHLVLHSRLGRVPVVELQQALWQERALYEWDAFIWPAEDLPLLRARMRHRRANPPARAREFLAANTGLRQRILRALRQEGPMLSRELPVARTSVEARHSWWGSGGVRLMLDLLQARGDVAVAGRRGTHRLWDLADRVYPPVSTIPWREAQSLIEQRERRALGVWLDRGRLRTYAGLPDDPVAPTVHFLSPFDRLIHDRRRAEVVFGFHYRLEMYVPVAKRAYGYYVLPILHGDRLVGRGDLRFDREARRLHVNRIWWEDGVQPVELDGAVAQLEGALAQAAMRVVISPHPHRGPDR